MTSFWVISGIFIVAALLFIIPALLRNRETQLKGVEHDAANISVYRDQLIELNSDLQNDILTQEQYERSKQELQQRMLQDVPEREKMTIKKTKSIHNIAMSSVIVLALPLAAVSLYLLIGDTRGLLPQAQLANATQMQRASNESPAGHDNFSSVVDNLVTRLNNNPDDVEGWVMLGRTYAIMGRYDDASNTYTKLVELVPDNPQILSDYADVLAMKNQGSLAGKPAELINEALRIDPEYPKALALAGTAEFEQARFEQAAIHWEKLLAVIPADSQLAKSVNESIAEARSLAQNGQTAEVPVQRAKIAEPEPVEASVNTQQPDTTAVAATTNTAIMGTVTLNQTLVSKASSNDTLFIYARAKTGPKMPLAILRLKVSDLPATFTLTDEMAMMPAMKLSSFPEVIVEARITKSGQAVPTSGDLQGFSQPVKIGDSNIAIEINRQVP
ncbi:cytochrome c-type biogenesis protein CcmH [Nitrosomonas cryotolerans]|uniref:Cytochrome c-type biogenesis protein CcmH n=1 Tax=Nitrosomonas cryotolerans ATCC 49181 TaxID=1131553 RepID=A0A1N6HYC4_9PROT|nr:c-type cytochrome biogenesis protein CcmI [Nitrosomonas cryotolerans]SFP68786.1 cytochrome c-type biogenesis protein CcmH [Nitrosomonas cryotolerans]SIO24740.1 cytochrome c-type biogenesis protein CcmH [Nitrosomonas cryotolerans ATCC 49181]